MQNTRLLVGRAVRSLTSGTVPRTFLAPRRYASNLDPTGRTPGFARRIRKDTHQRGAQQHEAQQHGAQRQEAQVPAGHQKTPESDPQTTPDQQQDKVANALQASSSDNTNQLLAPVHIPEDQHGILRSDHPATSILANSSIVVQRQLEMMNVLMGFEQANRYVMMDSTGNHIGYLAEQEHGIGNAVARQTFRTHRSFTTLVFDKNEKELLRFHRPFSWISSRIKVYDAVAPGDHVYSTSTALQGTSVGSITDQTSASISSLATSDMRVIGEAQQQWAPLRRKYNLFLHRPLSDQASDAPQLTAGKLPLSNSTALEPAKSQDETHGFAQFAFVDEPFLSWDFSLKSADDRLIGSVNRNFAGFAREIFTDTGVYALRMDSAGLASEPQHYISQTGAEGLKKQEETQKSESLGMTLDQRAVMLATAVSIDFDYFSRHSGDPAGGGFMPMWFPWMGGGAAAEGGAAGGAAEAGGVAAGEAGSGEAAAAAGAQNAARGVGSGEGAAAGAGSLAGYEAMQRGTGRNQPEDASPFAQDQPNEAQPPSGSQGNDDDFWGGFPPDGGRGGGSSGGGGGDGGGHGGGDGGGFDFDDFF